MLRKRKRRAVSKRKLSFEHSFEQARGWGTHIVPASHHDLMAPSRGHPVAADARGQITCQKRTSSSVSNSHGFGKYAPLENLGVI